MRGREGERNKESMRGREGEKNKESVRGREGKRGIGVKRRERERYLWGR